MVNVQFSNQENQTNFIEDAAPVQPSASKKKMRYVPIATACALLFVGGIAIYKWQTNDKVLGMQDTLPTPIPISNETKRENPVQPQDLVENEENQELLTANPVDIKSTNRPISVAQVKPTTATPRPKILINTNKGGNPVVTPQPKAKVVTTPTNTTVVEKVVVDDRLKPGTPTLSNCGDFIDNEWKNAKITLPKFDKAKEYWVQVGKSHGSNDVYDQHYSESDGITFERTLSNNQDYYVRFAIKTDGDFGKWSNTLKLNCHRQ